LARSYVNMRRYYGGGMAAVQHVGQDGKKGTKPPYQKETERPGWCHQ